MIPAARDRVQFPANWLSAECAPSVARTNAKDCPLCETASQSTTPWCEETSMPEITALAIRLAPLPQFGRRPRSPFSASRRRNVSTARSLFLKRAQEKEISQGEPGLSRPTRRDLPHWAQYEVLGR